MPSLHQPPTPSPTPSPPNVPIHVAGTTWEPDVRWYQSGTAQLVRVHEQVTGFIGDRLVRRLEGRWEQRHLTSYDTCQRDPVRPLATTQSHQAPSPWEPLESAADEADLDAMLEEEGTLHPRPPLPEYEKTLVPLRLYLALDKTATGPHTEANLALVTAQQLLLVERVARNYERQLGLNVTLAALHLTPDDPEIADIPHASALADFRVWLSDQDAEWDVACKRGAGLSGTTLGQAYIGRVGRETGVCVLRPDADWTTMAHEIGHVLGSHHSRGGMMHATASTARSESFFTDVSTGTTAARAIYDRAVTMLETPDLPWRHPGEMPFAEPDEIEATASPFLLNVLENDQRVVRHGQPNERLTLTEVSPIAPLGAAHLAIDADGQLRLTPNANGTPTEARFRYAMQGDQWWHAAEVIVRWTPQDASTEDGAIAIESDRLGTARWQWIDGRAILTLSTRGAMTPEEWILEASSHLRPETWHIQLDANGQRIHPPWMLPTDSPTPWFRWRRVE